MQFTNNEIATYLFCAPLSQTRTIPLTILEWNAVVKSLAKHGLQPEILQTVTSSELQKLLIKAKESQKSKIIKKVEARQHLGFSVLELEEIVDKGYGVLFRSYMSPRLKKLTPKFLPAFFYYAGDVSILTHRALGVVGARDANDQELQETRRIASDAANEGVVIISGGARGVDSEAVEATLQAGGKAIVFPADGLEKWVKKKENRHYIMNNQLLLMSTQRLKAPFSGSFAMQRNKFIHATSDAVLVASSQISGTKNSGTWEGVMENIKHEWSPLYVIGNSVGVEKLKMDGNAKEFTSFNQIYSSNKHKEAKILFENKAIELIKLGFNNGMDQEMIVDKFKVLLEQQLNSLERVKRSGSKSVESMEIEQICIEEIIRNLG